MTIINKHITTKWLPELSDHTDEVLSVKGFQETLALSPGIPYARIKYSRAIVHLHGDSTILAQLFCVAPALPTS